MKTLQILFKDVKSIDLRTYEIEPKLLLKIMLHVQSKMECITMK